MSKEIFEYARNVRNEKCGCLIAFKDEDGQVYFGHSFCNTKMDRFDKYLSVEIAAIRAAENKYPYSQIRYFIDRSSLIPNYAKEQYRLFVDRAKRYFKI